MTKVRTFNSGATRDTDTDKLDPEGFLSPKGLRVYFEYMHENRVQRDGSLRASDNWQKGIPKEAYMKSGWRHFFDWWCEHRKCGSREGLRKALCGLIFNAFGYLEEDLKGPPQLPHEAVRMWSEMMQSANGAEFDDVEEVA